MEKLIAEVIYLAVVAQRKTGRCIFIDYAGHVELFTIDIRASKSEYATEIARSEFYIKDNDHYRESAIANLERIKAVLEKAIENEQFDRNDFHAYNETVTRYTL